MKTKILFCVSCLVVILSESSSLGCSSSPYPPFGMPSYIDPDFKSPRYAEVKYRRWNKVERLLTNYAVPESLLITPSDTSLRNMSELEEPEAFQKYRQAAKYFETYDYDNAQKIFDELKNIRGPENGWWAKLFNIESYSWVKEASTYMTARCKLVLAQKKWNGYSNPGIMVDQKMLLAADSSYRYYLQEYPDGIYSYSARGIFRKIYYLMGKHDLLDIELKKAVKEHFDLSGTVPQRISNRINIMKEFMKLFKGKIDIAEDAPILCAYKLLVSDSLDPQEIAQLSNRKRDFKAYSGLYEYCQTLGLYKTENYQQLLEIKNEALSSDTILWLSTQLLRARAYVKQGDTSQALNIMIKMHDISPEDAIEVEIATLMLNNGDGLRLFSDNSPIKNYKNLQIFALYGLTDKELETGIAESDISGKKKEILADELAQRYLLSERYKELNNLIDHKLSLLFLPVKTIIEQLITNPDDINALTDMGEYLYKNRIRSNMPYKTKYIRRWTGSPDEDLSSCIPCQNYYNRSELYTPPAFFFLTVLGFVNDQNIKSEAEAKALHYIVVGGRDINTKGRFFWSRSFEDNDNYISNKDAFMRLHKLYPKSPWTKVTPYYYK